MAQKDKAEKQMKDVEPVAWELYSNRHKPGKRLNKDELWKEAEKIVRSRLRRTLFVSHRQLIQLERKIWEPLLAWADSQALLSLLGLIGNAGVIIAVVTYIGTEKQRRDAEVLSAWQTITSAHGQSGSGGRIQALEFLNASPGANWRRRFPWFCTPLPLCTWPAEPLDGINLSVDALSAPSESPEGTADSDKTEGISYVDIEEVYLAGTEGAYLAGIELPKASLVKANLVGADLSRANLVRANLWAANLQGAILVDANLVGAGLLNANLQGANLWAANLQRTTLVGTNLEGAELRQANLKGADLTSANLKGASLAGANLRGADLTTVNLAGAILSEANFQEAELWAVNLAGTDLRLANFQEAKLSGANLKGSDLRGANLQGAELSVASLEGVNLTGANLEGVKGLTDKQFTQAKLCLSVLPEGIILDPNRDCKELGIDPETGERIER